MSKSKIGIFLLPLLAALTVCLALFANCFTDAYAAGGTLPYGYNYGESGLDGLNFECVKNGGEKIKATSAGIAFSNEHGAGDGARVAGNYAFVADSAQDVVFDVTFTGFYAGADTRWINIFAGLAFGLSNKTDDFSQATFVGIGNLETTVISHGVKDDSHTQNCTIFAEAYNERVTMRVVGKKDGTVTIYRGYRQPDPNDNYAVKEESIEEVWATLTGCKVDGYIAFGIYNYSDFSGNFTFNLVDFDAKGRIDGSVTPAVSVKLNDSEFPYTFAGMPSLPLDCAVHVAPSGAGFSNLVNYSVVSGAATVSGGKLDITGGGSITLRATSVANPAVYDEKTFTAKAAGEYSLESYTVSDGFSIYDDSIWEKDDPHGRMGFGRGFSVNQDYIDGDYAGAKLVSKVRFSHLGASQVVFDLKVRSYGFHRYNYVDRWGVAFGLPERDSSVADGGVGLLWMSSIGMGLNVGGKEYTPDYVKPFVMGGEDRGLSSGYYVDTYNEAFVIRLIGYADGTLELYRTQAELESLADVKARWSGLNFDGYIALTSYCDYVNEENTQKSGCNFREFSVTGNALNTGGVEITNLSIDKDIFISVAQVEPPLELKAFVSASPSFDRYKAVDWTVVAGDASITEGKISFGSAGLVTIKAASRINPANAEEYTFAVADFRVNSLTVMKELFKDITDFTQPIKLDEAFEMDSTLRTPKYTVVDWEVVSGPARVQGGRLRILGTGKVTLRATARYDGAATDTVTFEVASYYGEDGLAGWAIALIVIGCVIAVAGIAVGVVFGVKKSKGAKEAKQ
ncbi:MAG: hypothetical protein K2L51_01955 [Clostridiales bacterium]|nr:hypothetical protein [Clostridiales bacterium]